MKRRSDDDDGERQEAFTDAATNNDHDRDGCGLRSQCPAAAGPRSGLPGNEIEYLTVTCFST